MHEIITIQLGQQSNYLGTHFWNAQESYFTYGGEEQSPVDHDVNFRPGIGADGSETYTPRAIFYDLKESFGTLKQVTALYELQNNSNVAGALELSSTVIRQPEIPPHPYQQSLDQNLAPPTLNSGTVRYWSDYNHVFYHPRSLVPLQTEPLVSSRSRLDVWDSGVELFDSQDQEHDILDRDFRFFAEECDQMQGVVVMAGMDDAWGGFASRYVERLRDEMGKGAIWVWGLGSTLNQQDLTRERSQLRLKNSILSLHSISPQASLYVPLLANVATAPSYLNFDKTSLWNTSALQAAAVETCSLPSRLRASLSSRGLLSDMEQIFTSVSPQRKILQLELSVKVNETQTNGLAGDSGSQGGQPNIAAAASRESDDTGKYKPLEISFFPSSAGGHGNYSSHLFSNISVSRGTPEYLASTSTSAHGHSLDSSLAQTHHTTLELPLLSSYPHIFRTRPSTKSVPALTSLSATSEVAAWLRTLAASTRILDRDQREDISSELRTWADEYIEGWESGDEEEWDD